ncbi:hypothetical protein [Bdellovibrio sp.]|uniref:hypothetical protein n=1 Tax=Bdellovibrio sp. TaxID=28201 RepID=UPI0039E3C5E1
MKTSRISRAALLLCITVLLSNCTTLQSHSGGSVTTSGQRIQVESTKFAVLNLTSMADEYIEKFRVSKKLHSQCTDGKVTDIETILWKRDWILFQTYNLDVTATCGK